MLKELINSDFRMETPDQRLIRLGVSITPSPDEHHMVNIRQGEKMFYYGFKLLEDYISFSGFLMNNQIRFTVPEASIGAIYPYHVGLYEPIKGHRLYTEDELYYVHFVLKGGDLKKWIEENKPINQFDKKRIERWKEFNNV